MTDRYHWRGGEECWMRIGVAHARQIIFIESLFEEKNRTRRVIAQVMRGLDAQGIGCTLPDLPGTGESLTDIATVSLNNWHDALGAVQAAINPVVTATFRGGAMFSGTGNVWHFSPESGARIVRDLKRVQLASASVSPLYAGHELSAEFLAELEATTIAAPAHVRTVRLESDAGDADAKLPGSPLWRRAEPGDDPALTAAIVADLTNWVKQCAAC